MTLMIDMPFPGLEPWVAYFKDVELPVLRHTANQLDELRKTADKVNIRKLAGIVLHDPLMTLRVFGHIEKNRGKRQVTDITTVERAVMMIGIYPFFEQFQNLPIIEQQLKGFPKAMLGLLRVISRARRASAWAWDWAALRHDPEIDEIKVAAQLHDFAEILMWCFAPTLATRVYELQAADRLLRSIAVQETEYGVALYQVKLELARAWGLPQLLVTLMDPENANSPRVRNVKLAVDLARHTANGWSDAALPDDFRDIEELLHLSHESLLERIGAPAELIAAARAARDAKEDAAAQ
ncbi:MAG: HDOD domain-containing protein [Rhodocyclales bacterium]|nr:HDOD domain-containing protein [Rhodocyclales bacterium]